LIQGIMTGVGFIGAGVIIRNQADEKIHGLTTAGRSLDHRRDGCAVWHR